MPQIKKLNKIKAFTHKSVSAFFMLCEKSRIIKARSPPARILEILSFSKFNREDNFFADNQVHICGRHDKRNRGNGRILHAIRGTYATGKAQPLERNAAAYLIGKLKRKRDRFCKSCRRSSFRSHTTRGRRANTSRIAVFPCCFFLLATPIVSCLYGRRRENDRFGREVPSVPFYAHG